MTERKPMAAAQERAACAVLAVLGGQNLGAALAAAARDRRLPAADPALAQELAFGTTRWLGRLRAILEVLRDGGKLEGRLAALLWVALYQLCLTTAPSHIVVDQTIRAIKARGLARAAGLANALLRRFLREREAMLSAADQNQSARFSYPDWWIAKLEAQYPGKWLAILDAGNARPPMTLRVNQRRIGRDDYLARLAAREIGARPAGDVGVILTQPQAVETLPGFSQGFFSVQDLGAQCAASLLACEDGMRVLDACAAPGGKSAHLLERNAIDLLALDQDAARLDRVDENLRRLGLAAQIMCGDAANPSAWWDGRPFDRILADVPCSASGVVRRHPDIKWLRRADDVRALAKAQRAIIDALWPTLAQGGRLLYATCSVFEEENERSVSDFLTRHGNAQRIALGWSEESAGQLLPAMPEAAQNHDGFYYALIEKT